MNFKKICKSCKLTGVSIYLFLSVILTGCGESASKDKEDDYLADADGDNVIDYLEEVSGTDKFNSDTDGDGLSDYDEIVLTKTDPTKYDSVTNGVSDADIDLDEDGLLNLEEIRMETDPIKTDTDEDGLTDYDEVKLYGTEPIKKDADEDGIEDGDEIVLGLNPTKMDSDEDGVLDGDEYFEQTVDTSRISNDLLENNCAVPSVTVSAKGNVNSSIYISEYTGYLKGDESFYVGKVVEIENVEMNGGTITFTLADSYTVKKYIMDGEETNALLIYYNDGETTTPLDTVYDEKNRTLSAKISAEGIYFVTDIINWMDSIGLEYSIKE